MSIINEWLKRETVDRGEEVENRQVCEREEFPDSEAMDREGKLRRELTNKTAEAGSTS